MTRRRFVQIDGELYERGTEPTPQGHIIMPDIQPYRSMIDGSMITSRSHHRAHLSQHRCVEVGNDLPTTPRGIPDAAPQQRKEIIQAQVDSMSHDEFKRAVKRDVEFVKWNSRGLPAYKEI